MLPFKVQMLEPFLVKEPEVVKTPPVTAFPVAVPLSVIF